MISVNVELNEIFKTLEHEALHHAFKVIGEDVDLTHAYETIMGID
jgi:hypothetical protein